MAGYINPTPPVIPYDTKPGSSLGREPRTGASFSDLTKVNAVYYPNYRVYRGETPASLNYGCISHVFYAFANVAPDGGVFLSDEWADAKMPVDGAIGCLGSLMRLKGQHPHLKLILSIGGGAASQSFAAVAASTVLRDNFGRSAKGLIDASGFDGIDIDWEHPSDAEQGRNFLSLLAAIRIYLPSNKYLLTAALPSGRWALQNIDLNKAAEYLNFINLMAYDFAGSWSAKSGHHAQLFANDPDEGSGAAGVDYTISMGFPASKILLGIPAYGQSFLGSNDAGEVCSGHGGEDGTFEYKTLPRMGCRELVNTKLVAAFCSGGDGGFVSYDNPETVGLKAQYVKQKALGGLFYWTATADIATGPRSLVAAGFKALHSL